MSIAYTSGEPSGIGPDIAIIFAQKKRVNDLQVYCDPDILLNDEKITTKQFIPVGHKIATKDISKGEDIIKYDNIIGTATIEIKKGDHIIFICKVIKVQNNSKLKPLIYYNSIYS